MTESNESHEVQVISITLSLWLRSNITKLCLHCGDNWCSISMIMNSFENLRHSRGNSFELWCPVLWLILWWKHGWEVRTIAWNRSNQWYACKADLLKRPLPKRNQKNWKSEMCLPRNTYSRRLLCSRAKHLTSNMWRLKRTMDLINIASFHDFCGRSETIAVNITCTCSWFLECKRQHYRATN